MKGDCPVPTEHAGKRNMTTSDWWGRWWHDLFYRWLATSWAKARQMTVKHFGKTHTTGPTARAKLLLITMTVAMTSYMDGYWLSNTVL